MLIKYVIFFVMTPLCSSAVAQSVFYQNSFFGGVVGSGFSQGINSGTVNNSIFIENIPLESTVLEVFLFAGRHGHAENLTIFFNGVEYELNDSNQVSTSFISPEFGGFSGVHCLNVKSSFLNSINEQSITFNQNELTPSNRYVDFYLLVLYQNVAMQAVCVSVFLNNSNLQESVEFNFDNLNPIDNSYDTGYAMHNGYICNTNNDGSYVNINDMNIGLIGGNNSGFGFCGGPISSFFYANGILSEYGESIANNSMADNDVLANIQEYVENLDSFISIDLITQLPNNKTNAYWTTVFTYTSPCQPFNAALLTTDTTTCAGVPVQLGATGGTSTGSAPAYEWLPQQNLSCYDCPNPVFLGDSTINYTVRIRNTDSCSVVYPVRVRVLPKPAFESIEITESVCGGATGSIEARPVSGAEPPHLFQLNGANTQLNEGNYSNLSAGFYTLTLTDGNACKRDSIVEIGEFNNVLADFSVNPTTGAAPLTVQTQNNSQNASNFTWTWADESSIFENPSIVLDTSGVYTLTLIANNGFEHCADTASLTILVFDSLQLIIPNVFTPNDDGSNDWFGITSNIDIQAEVVLLNRWGNVILEQKIDLVANTFKSLWDGANANDGVYFYKIIFTEEEREMSGFVELRR